MMKNDIKFRIAALTSLLLLAIAGCGGSSDSNVSETRKKKDCLSTGLFPLLHDKDETYSHDEYIANCAQFVYIKSDEAKEEVLKSKNKMKIYDSALINHFVVRAAPRGIWNLLRLVDEMVMIMEDGSEVVLHSYIANKEVASYYNKALVLAKKDRASMTVESDNYGGPVLIGVRIIKKD
jgi:hypothetical protein